MHDPVTLSCTAFAERLASREPVPGGGGASALAGALGAALCEMAGNLTLGRKQYADVAEDIRRMLDRCQRVRGRLLELVDLDAENFAPLSKAYSIPRDNPSRQAVMETALTDACKAPMEMMHCCGEAIELLSDMLQTCSALLISDVGCGAALCKAALQSASLSVFINTRLLTDRTHALTLEAEADGMLSHYVPLAERVYAEAQRRIRGRD